MTLRFVLDTSIVSEPMKKVPNTAVIRELERSAHECAIGAPVWHELRYGCERLPPGKRRAALEAYLHEVIHPSFAILPYDELAAAWHAGERARLERAGATAPFVDGQIAAIAKVHGLALVTANVADFERFEALEVVSWVGRPRRQPPRSSAGSTPRSTKKRPISR